MRGEQGADIDAAGRGHDTHAEALARTVVHELEDARAQGQRAACDDPRIAFVLERVHERRQRLAILGCARRLGLVAHVVQQALAAAGDLQQLTIAPLVPAPRHAQRLEGLVEGDPVAVALGLRQRPVNVP